MGVMVGCPSCRRMLDVPAELIGHEVRCSVCGQTFAAQSAPTVAAVGPGCGPASAGWLYGDEVYSPGFDLGQVDAATLDSWRCWRPTSFSVAGAVLLDIVTCGLFGLIYYGVKFSELPKASREDFGAGQGIGFMFIPYFKIYWRFRFWPGLADRLNLQLRLRAGNAELLPRGLALAYAILMVCCLAPYAGILSLVAGIVCREIFIAQMQTAINTMAAAPLTPQIPLPLSPTPQPPADQPPVQQA